MRHIVTIAGSPSGSAKSSAVLEYVRQFVRRYDAKVDTIVVRDLPAEDLIHARLDSPAIEHAHCLIRRAEGIVIATPVYKAAYAGVLKAFLDVLPQNAFQGKTIFPIATGGSVTHLLSLDYALKPVLSALGACHILRGIYIADAQIQFEHGGVLQLEETIEARLRENLGELLEGLRPPQIASAREAT